MQITHDKVGITLDFRPELISGAIWHSEGKIVMTPEKFDELLTKGCSTMVDRDMEKTGDK